VGIREVLGELGEVGITVPVLASAGRPRIIETMTLEPSRSAMPDEITQLIVDSSQGRVAARDRLLDLVYAELHALARSRMRGERGDHTLGATALVNEAYLRLFGDDGSAIPEGGWGSRSALFAAAATTMRRILIDHARARTAQKRGGPRVSSFGVPLDVIEAARTAEPDQILALDEAITRLETIDARAAQVVRLRFYAGLELADVARLNDVTDRTVKRDWNFARAWLRQQLGNERENDDDTGS
jgi:RNA polymerase sigma factor (TIGR02999 family)